MYPNLFTSESVACGHPDKVADQISDAILDACLAEDPDSKVACETLVTTNLVVLAGEISTRASVNYEEVTRNVIKEIGYDNPDLGFDNKNCKIISALQQQSPDIAQGVEGRGLFEGQGAGDQGMMFGFACDETPELMPLSLMLAHRLIHHLYRYRKGRKLPYLRPDGKTQVTVEYEGGKPVRLHTVVIGTQHHPDVSWETIRDDMVQLAKDVLPNAMLDEKTHYFVNPSGRFVLGGPAADSGLTGRKIMVDTYGGMGRHGGGAFSGKDPSKVDRSAAYAARYIAKHIVGAGFARRCEVQVAYALGVPFPVSIKVDTFGTGVIEDTKLATAVASVFDLSPFGITQMLQLKRPIYRKTAAGGHFGRENEGFPWEQLDRLQQLKDAVLPQMSLAQA